MVVVCECAAVWSVLEVCLRLLLWPTFGMRLAAGVLAHNRTAGLGLLVSTCVGVLAGDWLHDLHYHHYQLLLLLLLLQCHAGEGHSNSVS